MAVTYEEKKNTSRMKLRHWINNNQLSALRKRVYLFLKRDRYMNTFDGYNFEIHGKFFSNSKFYISNWNSFCHNMGYDILFSPTN